MKKDLAKDSITEAVTSQRLFAKEYKKQMENAAAPIVQSEVKEYDKDDDYIFIAKTEKKKKPRTLQTKILSFLLGCGRWDLNPYALTSTRSLV